MKSILMAIIFSIGFIFSSSIYAVILDPEPPKPVAKPKPKTKEKSQLELENERLRKDLEKLQQTQEQARRKEQESREELQQRQEQVRRREQEMPLENSRQVVAPDNPQMASIGEKIYERAFGRGCGACHDISSNPQLAELIKAGLLDKSKFSYVVKNGRNGMPKAITAIMEVGPVKNAGLTEDQAIDAVYQYLKM